MFVLFLCMCFLLCVCEDGVVFSMFFVVVYVCEFVCLVFVCLDVLMMMLVLC